MILFTVAGVLISMIALPVVWFASPVMQYCGKDYNQPVGMLPPNVIRAMTRRRSLALVKPLLIDAVIKRVETGADQ
jgi:hypothetical protein